MSTFLDADRLRRATVPEPWSSVQVVDSTGSTNADLVAAARDGAASGTVLVSAHQSAGRGRFDRVWEAPPDTAVAVSVLVRPRRPLEHWGWLSVIAGMAVTDAVRLVGGLDASLKWPNDVLVDGRKLCGILSEAVPTDAGMAAVVGMGLSVALTREQLPVPTATSVRLEVRTPPRPTWSSGCWWPSPAGTGPGTPARRSPPPTAGVAGLSARRSPSTWVRTPSSPAWLRTWTSAAAWWSPRTPARAPSLRAMSYTCGVGTLSGSYSARKP